MSTPRNQLKTHLPFIPAKAVDLKGWIICLNCGERHGLFYRRHGPKRADRSLNYLCDSVVRGPIVNSYGGVDEMRLHTMTGQVAFVEGLPIKEEWTPKYKKEFQAKAHGSLI